MFTPIGVIELTILPNNSMSPNGHYRCDNSQRDKKNNVGLAAGGTLSSYCWSKQ